MRMLKGSSGSGGVLYFISIFFVFLFFFLRQLPCKGCRGGNENVSECARIFGVSDVNTTQLIHRKVFDSVRTHSTKIRCDQRN